MNEPTALVLVEDCLATMADIPTGHVDAIVTDPPYGLGFMGRAWDDLPPGIEWARECLRILKPGGHLLAFGGTRTWHRLAVAVEDAGFEMRDSIAWLYGSGFPKSLDVSKAIDKATGAERKVIGKGRPMSSLGVMHDDEWKSDPTYSVTAPATPEAQQWAGWGTALKPAFEPIVVARKPFKGNVAANVLAHGTGALNIDGCRIASLGGSPSINRRQSAEKSGNAPGRPGEYRSTLEDRTSPERYTQQRDGELLGRWPANVVLDDDQAAALDEQSGTSVSTPFASGTQRSGGIMGETTGRRPPSGHSDTGGASRFFYCAKAPKRERPVVDGVAHPTVKPLGVMRWLVRLVTPPGGVVYDPFAGSGATVEAALLEGFDVIASEKAGPEGTPEAKYPAMIDLRIERARRAAA